MPPENFTSSLLEGDLPSPSGRWLEWLNRRIPPRRAVTLTQKNIFIFPPRAGLAFGLLIVLLILVAINYQNSLVFGLAFMLGSMFVVAIGHTFNNLAGLEIEAAGVSPVFVGEHAMFVLRIARKSGKAHHSIRLGWPGEALQTIDLDDETEIRVRVPVRADHRGWLHPGRIRFETTWPVGLLRAWTWLDPAQRALVYPHPVAGPSVAQAQVATGDGEVVVPGGTDDFLALREYQPGDPLKHVAWKSFARGGDLMLKEFGGYADRRTWLEWDSLPGLDTESRLSRLTHWALEFESSGDEYGLRMPGVLIEPGRGPEHRARVLQALALHGIETLPAEAGGVPMADGLAA